MNDCQGKMNFMVFNKLVVIILGIFQLRDVRVYLHGSKDLRMVT